MFDIRTIQKTRSTFESVGGPTVTTVQASFGHADLDDVLAGRALAESVIATSDGRGYARGVWHDGPEADSVYVEVYDRGGRTFHGFIDSASRRLVQAG